MTTFDLSHLGAELDASRRSRQSQLGVRTIPITSPSYDTEKIQSPPGLSSSIESDISVSSSFNTLPESEEDQHLPIAVEEPPYPLKSEKVDNVKGMNGQTERDIPYPLCLLCLTRPPSAVLLPCCHLNLCYICAPLLIHRSCPNPSSSSAPSPPMTSFSYQPAPSIQTEPLNVAEPAPQPQPEPRTRVPFNLLLMKATANHSKSRKLALGGYLPPERNKLNGEWDGVGLLDLSCLPPSPQDQTKYVNGSNEGDDMMMDISQSQDDMMDYGRIHLRGKQNQNDVQRQEAKCLVCREGIKGWLRVYTG